MRLNYIIIWVLIKHKENMKNSLLIGVVLGCQDGWFDCFKSEVGNENRKRENDEKENEPAKLKIMRKRENDENVFVPTSVLNKIEKLEKP